MKAVINRQWAALGGREQSAHDVRGWDKGPLEFEFEPEALSRTNGPRTAWNRSALTDTWMPTRFGSGRRRRASQGVGAAEPVRGRQRHSGWVAVGWRCRSGKQQRALISDGGGRMDGKGGGWLAGSQIMPIDGQGASLLAARTTRQIDTHAHPAAHYPGTVLLGL